jgi:hypothetical protein
MYDPYSARRYRAKAALVAAHPDEFEDLVADFRQRWLTRARDKARNELARRHAAEYRRLLTDQALRQTMGEATDDR